MSKLLATLNAEIPSITKAARTPTSNNIQNAAQTSKMGLARHTLLDRAYLLCGPMRGNKIENCVASESFVL